MNTFADTRLVDAALWRTAPVLIGLVAAVLAAGCGGQPYEEGTLPLQQLESAVTDEPGDCPIGTCNGQNNGKGIYIGERFSYCIRDVTGSGYKFFCPERFQPSHAGGFLLTGQRLVDGLGVWPSPPQYMTIPVQAQFIGSPVTVLDITAATGELAVTVSYGSQPIIISGSSLNNLVLSFSTTEFVFKMKLVPEGLENGLSLYRPLTSVTPNVWQSYCADGLGTAAFLPERAVNGAHAGLTSAARTTTMACRTGSIGTCMLWGYRPWQSSQDPSGADSLYGSCLQAKRAAYFLQSGDLKSYTVQGTPLAVHDKNGILADSMPGVEAIWSPQGAVCLSPEYRRVPPTGSLPPLPVPNPLPPCSADLHLAAQQGTLQGALTAGAPLATGLWVEPSP